MLFSGHALPVGRQGLFKVVQIVVTETLVVEQVHNIALDIARHLESLQFLFGLLIVLQGILVLLHFLGAASDGVQGCCQIHWLGSLRLLLFLTLHVPLHCFGQLAQQSEHVADATHRPGLAQVRAILALLDCFCCLLQELF